MTLNLVFNRKSSTVHWWLCGFKLICFVLLTTATWLEFISRHTRSQRWTIWKLPISLTSTSSEATVTGRKPAKALGHPPVDKQTPRLFTSLPHLSPARSKLVGGKCPNPGETLHLPPVCQRWLEQRRTREKGCGKAWRGKALRRRTGGREKWNRKLRQREVRGVIGSVTESKLWNRLPSTSRDESLEMCK